MNPSLDDILELPSLPLSERGSLPSVPAVYFTYCGRTILYIGRTSCLSRRWVGHHRSQQLQQMGAVAIAWLVTPPASLRKVERRMIQVFSPRLNETPVVGTSGVLVSSRFPLALKQALDTVILKRKFRNTSHAVEVLIEEHPDIQAAKKNGKKK